MNEFMETMRKFNKELNNFDVGYISTEGELVSEDEYKTLPPEIFLKYKKGYFYDYVAYQNYAVKRLVKSLLTLCYCIIFTDKDSRKETMSHAFMTFINNNKHYLFESGFKQIAGIYKSEREEPLIKFVVNNIIKYMPELKNCSYTVTIYDPKETIGLTKQQFYSYQRKFGKEVLAYRAL